MSTCQLSQHTPIAWFEIVTDNLNRACQFYEAVFNVTLERQQMSEIQMAIFPYKEGFPSGALVKGACYAMHNSGCGKSIIYLNSPSIQMTLEKVKQQGGKIIFDTIALSGNLGFIAGFEDTEGNVIGLWSTMA